MKILIVNTHLSTGGIATSLVNLCEQLKDYSQVDIDVVLLNQNEGDVRYKLPGNVNMKQTDNKYLNLYTTPFRHTLENKNIIIIIKAFFIKLIAKIMKPEKFMKLVINKGRVSKRYDVAISFRNDEYQHKPYSICGCNDFVLQCIDADKKIAWIHNDPDRHGFTYEIAKYKFKDFDTIVNVSQGCKDRFDEIIPEYKSKSKLVYNAFNYDYIIEKSTEFNPYEDIDDSNVKLVTVGRIANEQKRMDRIVKVCTKLRKKGIYNYIWHIVGDGPDAEKLKSRVIEEGLINNIILVGKKSNPFPYIKYADCLVMTSEYEAYGMTLVEALTVETPVITTNHLAAKEIVQEGINGFIAENNSESIAEQVCFILENRKILDELRENIKNTEIDRNIAINQFLEVIGLRNEE
ncbi:MAG: glycosyltransferase [Romboutsia timonensis]|uniref:glycosyltransferase n=1 Tax=Romboutsia timonensis TaxID=1776391 RepID=UPI002A74D605|nr:glycosyltransferase [Romboutsia timonensis]MDY3001345.1 glycosyltransferase [Romboutsia timonensis]